MSEQEVYDHVGRLITDLLNDEDLGPKLGSANTVVRYVHTDPDATITVSLRSPEPSIAEFGASDAKPEVTMRMPADIAHRFWLGQVNVAIALTRGQIQAEGPAEKILRLVPLTAPAIPRYREQLIAQGREDLVEV